MNHLDSRKYIILLVVILAVFCLVAASIGRYSMNPADVLGALYTKVKGLEGNKTMENVLFLVRFPRILAAVIVGAALSLSGAIYQGIFKNPLVSPDLLGVSSGACVGAAIAILLGFNLAWTQVFAFAGGLVAVNLAVLLSKILRSSSNIILVLSGIIISGLMGSILGVLKFIADPETELSSIVYWQMGSIAGVSLKQVFAVIPLMITAMVIMLLLSWRINIMSFGEQEAKSLGINVVLLRGIAIICASLLTASAVSISGTIGWIGLVIPHLGRILVGPDNTKLFPVTLLQGSIFLLLIDTISRVATSVEIPLSILTGLIGAPFYAYILWERKTKLS